MDKIKILTLGDHPFSPSGVGIQSRYMIEGLLETGKYSVVSLGGAIKHQNTTPIVTEKWGDEWKIFPVGGQNNKETVFGTPEIVRSVVRTEKPDIVWFMTDPHWYRWLWQIEDEIRPLVPMVYYHVWDNFPAPQFNKSYYDSTDFIVSASRVTEQVVSEVAPNTKQIYLPHTTDTNIFKKLPEAQVAEFKESSLGPDSQDRVVFFWNNRNARRKQASTVLWWFNEFLGEVGKENACLIMHTDPEEASGSDLTACLHAVGATNGEIMLSTTKYPAEQLAAIYNMADCTINIADAEGFGLSTLESLACETPIIVNMTGGLQEQVKDSEGNLCGIGIEPSTKSVIGSQIVPYIYEDRVSKEDFKAALHHIYNLEKKQRQAMGAIGRQHVLANFGMDSYISKWDELFTSIHNDCGSWDTRKGHKNWEVREL